LTTYLLCLTDEFINRKSAHLWAQTVYRTKFLIRYCNLKPGIVEYRAEKSNVLMLVQEESDLDCMYSNRSFDNIFAMFGGRVYQQKVGTPMGTNCVPLHADLFLHSYEACVIQEKTLELECLFLQTKICAFLEQCICIYVGNS
jgi:hypothetical protein